MADTMLPKTLILSSYFVLALRPRLMLALVRGIGKQKELLALCFGLRAPLGATLALTILLRRSNVAAPGWNCIRRGGRKMRLDELPRSNNVEDRRSEDGGASFRIPGGRGGLGIGTIIVLGLVGDWLGIDPSVLIGGAEIVTGGGTSQQQSSPGPRDSAQTGAPSDQMGQFVSAVLGSTEAQ